MHELSQIVPFFFTVKRGFSHFLNRRRQNPPVNAVVCAGDEAAGRVRREEHRGAEQPYLAARCDSYEDRIKSLKSVRPEVEPTYFDTLLAIQQVTSTKVHENSYDGWEARHLRIILAALSEVLHELYVLPAVRDDRRKAVLALGKELGGEEAITGADD